MTREYVLGTGLDETARLALQHRLWASATHDLWEHAGLRPGLAVLDAGCGPGHATMDLAQVVGPSGRVVGLDESGPFLKELGDQAKARRLDNVERVLGDVQNLTASITGGPQFDLAYIRWVLCFVKNPGDVIKGLAALLKPGSRLAITDYFNYAQSMTIAPRSQAIQTAVAAVDKSWRDRGGNPDVVEVVPGLLQEHGFDITHFDVISRTARSPAGATDTFWHWPDTFFRIFFPKLAESGHLTQAQCDAALADWDAACRNPAAFVLCPSVFQIVAVRR